MNHFRSILLAVYLLMGGTAIAMQEQIQLNQSELGQLHLDGFYLQNYKPSLMNKIINPVTVACLWGTFLVLAIYTDRAIPDRFLEDKDTEQDRRKHGLLFACYMGSVGASVGIPIIKIVGPAVRSTAKALYRYARGIKAPAEFKVDVRTVSVELLEVLMRNCSNEFKQQVLEARERGLQGLQ